MAPARTSWTWGRGESCAIRVGEITVAQADPWGGAGASCTLREFLDGQLTWLLPEDVRREALAAAQDILGDDRPLRPAVLRGDESRLGPGTRAVRKQGAKAERALGVEKARLARKLTRKDVPPGGADCFVCLRLFSLYQLNRSGFEKVMARFRHPQHEAASSTLDRKLAELQAASASLPLADCERCRSLPDEVRATQAHPLPPEARRVLDLPTVTPFGPHYRQCPQCGRHYLHLVTHYEWNESPSPDDTIERLVRRDWTEIRGDLRARMAEGTVPEWVERALPTAPELSEIPWGKLRKKDGQGRRRG